MPNEMTERPRAWSVNGRDAEFIADFGLETSTGGFVIIETSDGRRLVGQVRERRLGSRDGVRVDTGSVRILGALDAGRLVSAAVPPFAATPLTAAGVDDVAVVCTPPADASRLDIGQLVDAEVSASLRAKGFARHTFLCGQSGSGKTYSLGVVLEQLLLETQLPIVIVDPNSDHVHLGALGGLPEGAHVGEVVVAGRGPTASRPLRIHLSDLTLEEQALTLGLDPIDDADEFGAFADAVTALGRERYGMHEVELEVRRRLSEADRRLARRIANLGVASWGIWAGEGEPSLVDIGTDWRVIVLDTGSLDAERERAVVSLALLGVLRRRAVRRSVLLVLDEAHNVCPPESRTRLGEAVTEHAVWIAGEGRKFGIHLLLATQRPQKIHENVVSQCDNLLLMRVNSSEDIARLAATFSHVPRPMLEESASFGLGEMLAAGPVSPVPMRLRTGARRTPEGGADLPTDWADRPS
jgi:uncharacterized protein